MVSGIQLSTWYFTKKVSVKLEEKHVRLLHKDEDKMSTFEQYSVYPFLDKDSMVWYYILIKER